MIALSLQKVITGVVVINNDMGDVGDDVENKCSFFQELAFLYGLITVRTYYVKY